MYYVYLVKCADNTLYTGITVDLQRRLLEHNGTSKGAKYTAQRRPVKIVYSQEYETRALASVEECRIKKLTRIQKLTLIDSKRETDGR